MTFSSLRWGVFLPILLTASAAWAQAPAVNAGGIVNHFSQAAAALPNGSIAQGSLFDINGKNLGPADPVTSSDTPVSAALAGVSVQVNVGGKITNVPLVSVSAGQIMALLPSATPVGTGTLTVTVNGLKSATAPITVVKTSLGIQKGMNISDGNGGLTPNSPNVTIQPGQTAVFLGTGIGAVPFDETTGAPMQDLDLDIKAYIGGVEAQILFKGRAPGQVGIDEFDVVIPDGLPAGCNVSVVFVAAGLISNYTLIAVGDGGPCADQPVNNLPTEGFMRTGAIELVRSAGKLNLGAGIQDYVVDSGASAYSAIDYSKLVFTPGRPATVVGPCTVSVLPPPPQPNNGNGANATSVLDAGAVFTVKGPNGTKTLAKNSAGFGSILGQVPVIAGAPNPGPLYISPGTYTFDNGAGGKDVGAFTATYTMQQPMVWTNADALTASGITRSAGFEITWTPGGDPDALISVGGTSRLAGSQVGGQFSCTVHEGEGRLVIPPIVTMVLPPSAVVSGVPTGVLTVTWSSFKTFTFPGIDFGNIGAAVGVTRSLSFK